MKKTFLVSMLFISVTAAYAQPNITGNNFNPTVGETITLLNIADSLPGTAGVAIGANQTWNFQTLSGGTSENNVYISPEGMPNASHYSSNLCLHNTSSGDYNYYYADDTKMQYLGLSAATGGNGNSISNASSMYKFPMTFNTNYSETINDQLTDIASGMHQESKGQQTWVGVGYGTLILPTGTFNNVLKVVHTIIDTIYYNNAVSSTSKSVTTEWWYPGIHGPVLSSNVTSNIPSGQNGTITASSYYTTSTPLAVNEIIRKKFHFSCYPNPAQDKLNLVINIDQPADITVNIMTVDGKIIATTNEGHYATSGQINIPVPLDKNALSSGIYMVDLNVSGTHIFQQFVKN